MNLEVRKTEAYYACSFVYSIHNISSHEYNQLHITDLSRTIDSSIKDKINDLTGNEEYEFGDLSRLVDSKIKGEVNKFTNSTSYEFGDLSKEIVRRVATGKYTLDDLFMLFKALAMVGASLSPVGKCDMYVHALTNAMHAMYADRSTTDQLLFHISSILYSWILTREASSRNVELLASQ